MKKNYECPEFEFTEVKFTDCLAVSKQGPEGLVPGSGGDGDGFDFGFGGNDFNFDF